MLPFLFMKLFIFGLCLLATLQLDGRDRDGEFQRIACGIVSAADHEVEEGTFNLVGENKEWAGTLTFPRGTSAPVILASMKGKRVRILVETLSEPVGSMVR